jgi:hypothetical protein
MTKKWFDAALRRALRTFLQSLSSTLPVGIVVTPTMIRDADWSIFLVILAWLLTGALAGLASLLTSLVRGLPEIEDQEEAAEEEEIEG